MKTLSSLQSLLVPVLVIYAIGSAVQNYSPCALLEQRVRQLITEIAIPNPKPDQYELYSGKQAQIFVELEKLGRPAVPYIVRYMDDRRPLQYQYLKLEIRAPNAFEAFRWYSPAKVVDALADILNQMTPANFGVIYSQRRTRTEDERDVTVAGLRKCAEDNNGSFSRRETVRIGNGQG